MKSGYTFLLALAFCSLFGASAAQQALAQTTATIIGTVQDASGAVIAEANITATNTATGLESVSRTDGKGAYIFTALPVGSYRVRTEKAGFKTGVQEDVVL